MCRAWARSGMLAALLLALGGCAKPPPDMVLVDRGAGAYAAGDAAAAEAALSEALAVNPDNGAALLSLGALYERTGRSDEAKRVYGDVLARFGPAEAATIGIGSTERSAFAALARIRLARLDGGAHADGMTAAVSPDVLRAVFANLKRVSENLEALSKEVRSAVPARSEAATSAMTEAAGDAPAPEAGAPAMATPAEATVAEPAQPTPAVRVHLASYRSAKKAKLGWQRLSERYPDLLGKLQPDTVRVDLGPGMGIYYRLVAGPFAGEAEARALCRALKSKGAFCALLFG